MKANPIIFATLVIFAACQPSKKETTPSNKIQDAFKKLHPTATVTEWKDESPTWEAKYEDGDAKGAVSFDANGIVTEIELVIAEDLLPNPSSVQEYIKANYPDEKMQRCEKITTADGRVTYEIQIKGKELVFDADGKFIEEEPD